MKSIAIIGTGISGMACGHFLHKHFEVDMYEKDNYPGGHSNTIVIEERESDIPIDTGFIVFNKVTYPNLVRLLDELNVDYQPTDMSFSVQHLPSGLEYSSKNLFAQKSNFFNPRFFVLLFQIQKFYREADQILQDSKYRSYSIGDYLRENDYSNEFANQYILPMGSALWSTPPETTLNFPVTALIDFFKNHGLLGIDGQLQWYTVKGGSVKYRDKLIAPIRKRMQIGNPVLEVYQDHDKVVVVSKQDLRKYDKVIFACHADQTLQLLKRPTALEGLLLEPFHYHKNAVTLHKDSSVMPRKRSAWAAWNYRVESAMGGLAATTIYDMNRLQKLQSVDNYFVSLNDPGLIHPAEILYQVQYEHPVFTTETEAVQPRLRELNENGSKYFCGSYFGFGFHEDALTSAIQVCSRIIGGDPWTFRKNGENQGPPL